MIIEWKHALIAVGYYALFGVSLLAIGYRNRKRRNKRSPFKPETRVLRSPGESLRKRIIEIDEAMEGKFVLAAAVPVTIGWLLLLAVLHLTGRWLLTGIAVDVLVFAISFVLAAQWISRRFFERSNHELGWYGERVVGDELAPLEREGWRTFHDFPREAKGAKFNIDHIAVGPTGIFAIETKTPRKVKTDDGHVITFDGKTLKGPGGWSNQDWLNQATNNAAWLEKWLRDRTGEKFDVEAVLTFPDWLVPEECRGPPLVVNSSRLIPCLTEGSAVLDPKQIDRVARLIEGVCRDVAF